MDKFHDTFDCTVPPAPVMGRIAAGIPISAIQNHSHSFAVPREMMADGEHFALEVQGDSMIEGGILDGDTSIFKKTGYR